MKYVGKPRAFQFINSAIHYTIVIQVTSASAFKTITSSILQKQMKYIYKTTNGKYLETPNKTKCVHFFTSHLCFLPYYIG